ncbi:MAG: tetratricopeptide repeat protein, partial [Deltaproteobacteria bacterium]|nr:tetratricopeptide repeat protein [Deltaproteobacteria bacterium]
MRASFVFVAGLISLLLFSSTASGVDPDELVRQGVALHKDGKLKEALALYEKALDKDMTHREGMFHLALVYYDLKDYTKARQAAHDAAIFHPDDMRAILLAGRTELIAGDVADSRKYFMRYLERNPSSVLALTSLGQAEYVSGNFRMGIEYLQQALSLDPRNSRIAKALAEMQALTPAWEAEQERQKQRLNQWYRYLASLPAPLSAEE